MAKKCIDSKKAERFFKERNTKFQLIDLKKKSTSKDELTSVVNAVGDVMNMVNPDAKDKFTLSIYKYLSFYRQFPDVVPTVGAESDKGEIVPTAGAQLLSWSQYRALLSVENKDARNWYAKEAYEQTALYFFMMIICGMWYISVCSFLGFSAKYIEII